MLHIAAGKNSNMMLAGLGKLGMCRQVPVEKFRVQVLRVHSGMANMTRVIHNFEHQAKTEAVPCVKCCLQQCSFSKDMQCAGLEGVHLRNSTKLASQTAHGYISYFMISYLYVTFCWVIESARIRLVLHCADCI